MESGYKFILLLYSGIVSDKINDLKLIY